MSTKAFVLFTPEGADRFHRECNLVKAGPFSEGGMLTDEVFFNDGRHAAHILLEGRVLTIEVGVGQSVFSNAIVSTICKRYAVEAGGNDTWIGKDELPDNPDAQDYKEMITAWTPESDPTIQYCPWEGRLKLYLEEARQGVALAESLWAVRKR